MYRTLSSEIRLRARLQREEGKSIGVIARDCNVAKSTVYEWTKTIENAEKFARLGKERWLKVIQPMGAQAQHEKRERKVWEIKKEVDSQIIQLHLSKEEKRALLSALYWAEGTKVRGMMKFTNTDPLMMHAFITLLRDCYKLDETKFRVRLHLHSYHNENEVKLYWSKKLRIPEKQFQKTYWKQRSKERVFRKNFGGICILSYNSDYLREQLVQHSIALGHFLTHI